MPVAESLGYGRMCLASNATSVPEIRSDLPEYCEIHDAVTLFKLVQRVVSDPAWVQQREKQIRDTFTPTSWKQTAEQVVTAIQCVMHPSREPVKSA